MPAIHAYNSGIEGRKIFADQDDFDIFIGYLNQYLNPPVDPKELKKTFEVNGKKFSGVPHLPKNFHGKVELVKYSLTPEEFHLIVRENEKNYLQNFIRSLCTRYSIYYNKKYKRTGPLFVGPYKSEVVDEKFGFSNLDTKPSKLEKSDLNKKKGYNSSLAFGLAAMFFILTGVGLGNVQKEQERTITASAEEATKVLAVSTQEVIPTVTITTLGNTTVGIFAEPDVNSKELAKATNGHSYELVEEVGAWYKIRLDDSSIGYILSRYISQ